MRAHQNSPGLECERGPFILNPLWASRVPIRLRDRVARVWASVSGVGISFLGVLMCLALAPGAAYGQVEFAFGREIGDFHGQFIDGKRPRTAFGAELRFPVDRVTQLGFEVARASYPVRAGDEDGSQLHVFGVFRRYTSARTARLFVGGKIGYAREAAYSDVFQEAVVAEGIAGGPTAGLQIGVGSIKLEAAVDLLYNAFSDPYSRQTTVDGGDTSQFRWGSRIGFAIPFSPR